MSPSRFDRLATGLAALAAGPTILAGMFLGVWEADETVRAYLQTYLVDPDRSQLSAVLLHFGYLLLLPALLGLAAVTRAAPRLRATGLVFGMLGLSTLPGLLVVDFYDLALAQTLPLDQAVAVVDATEQYWGPLVLFIPTMLGILLAVVLLSVAACRVGFLPWWSAALLIAGIALLTFVRGGGLTTAVISTAVLGLGLTDAGWRLIRSASAAPVLDHRSAASQPTDHPTVVPQLSRTDIVMR